MFEQVNETKASIHQPQWVVTGMYIQGPNFSVREETNKKLIIIIIWFGFLKAINHLLNNFIALLKAENCVCYSDSFLLNFWLETVSGCAFMLVQCDI